MTKDAHKNIENHLDMLRVHFCSIAKDAEALKMEMDEALENPDDFQMTDSWQLLDKMRQLESKLQQAFVFGNAAKETVTPEEHKSNPKPKRPRFNILGLFSN